MSDIKDVNDKNTLNTLKYELDNLRPSRKVYSKSCKIFFLCDANRVRASVDKKLKAL